MVVIIFATSIYTIHEKQLIEQQMNSIAGGNNWSIDLGDPDKILRVVASTEVTFTIVDLLYSYNFSCTLLDVYDLNQSCQIEPSRLLSSAVNNSYYTEAALFLN